MENSRKLRKLAVSALLGIVSFALMIVKWCLEAYRGEQPDIEWLVAPIVMIVLSVWTAIIYYNDSKKAADKEVADYLQQKRERKGQKEIGESVQNNRQ